MQCPLCGYYMASFDTKCLRCHGQGLKGRDSTRAAITADSPPGSTPPDAPTLPLPGALTSLTDGPPPRFVPAHASPQPGGANARANDSLRDDPVLEELSRNPRRVALDGSQGLSFGAIFVLFFVVFIALPWGCAKMFMPAPQKSPAFGLPTAPRGRAGDGATTDTKTDMGASDTGLSIKKQTPAEGNSTPLRNAGQTGDSPEAMP